MVCIITVPIPSAQVWSMMIIVGAGTNPLTMSISEDLEQPEVEERLTMSVQEPSSESR